MKISKLQQSLQYLDDMSWRFEYNPNGRDGYRCPGGCLNYVHTGNNSYEFSTEHWINCPYLFIVKTITDLIELENPDAVLKEIL